MSVQESEFDQLVAGITVACDYNTADQRCDDPVKWFIRYHSCNEEILCEPHATEFIAQVIFTMQKYGSVICTECEKEFYRLSDFIRTKPV